MGLGLEEGGGGVISNTTAKVVTLLPGKEVNSADMHCLD